MAIPIRESDERAHVEIPEDVYIAKIESVAPHKSTHAWGEGKGVKVVYIIQDKKYSGLKVSGVLWLHSDSKGLYLSQNSTAYKSVTTLLGENLTSFDPKQLVGKTCKVYVENVQKGDRKYAIVKKILEPVNPEKVAQKEVEFSDDEFLKDIGSEDEGGTDEFTF